jgi:hypothetical protein
VTDKQQTSIRHQSSQLGKGLASVKATSQRRVGQQPLALLTAPVGGGQLSGLASARLGAEQDCVKEDLQTLERDPSRARLAFTARCQEALSIGTSAVGLRLCVT